MFKLCLGSAALALAIISAAHADDACITPKAALEAAAPVITVAGATATAFLAANPANPDESVLTVLITDSDQIVTATFYQGCLIKYGPSRVVI